MNIENTLHSDFMSDPERQKEVDIAYNANEVYYRYIESANISMYVRKIDNKNYGRPPEESNIHLNPKIASKIEPQAWEDEFGNFFYNWPGAMKLAKFLQRQLPNIADIISAIDENPDDFRQNVGYRSGSQNRFYGFGEYSYFWSETPYDNEKAYYACLRNISFSSEDDSIDFHHRGLSVRFYYDS